MNKLQESHMQKESIHFIGQDILGKGKKAVGNRGEN
jgi:hypothetical protein